jgi:glycosyltransferase involved in cell wall biosynthesis
MLGSVAPTNTANHQAAIQLSVVVPIYNEYDSLPKLVEALTQVLTDLHRPYEIICVDDGSTDGSATQLRQLVGITPLLRAILLRRNYGQTAAMAAGFDYARGNIIVTMDGDLQNDPVDIPRLLDRLDDGFDLVSGWRKHRQDNPLTRLLPSKMANWLIARVTGVKLHDYGCSLKAYRGEVVRDMNLYGELHRFLPALAFIEGARITEIPVTHHPRRFGISKYGLGRSLRVVMDLLTVYFMKKFLTQPMHIFGMLGLVSMLSGIGIGFYLALVKFLGNQDIGDRPLLFLAIVLFISGIQLFSVGLLAELMMRTYHESQRRPIYRVREVLGDSAPQQENGAHHHPPGNGFIGGVTEIEAKIGDP